jgi:hypothetical protein
MYQDNIWVKTVVAFRNLKSGIIWPIELSQLLEEEIAPWSQDVSQLAS